MRPSTLRHLLGLLESCAAYFVDLDLRQAPKEGTRLAVFAPSLAAMSSLQVLKLRYLGKAGQPSSRENDPVQNM